ncbi:MAG: hypothetical protein PHX78_08780 [bacterium]|nr:hypothetical protein [bacterium]
MNFTNRIAHTITISNWFSSKDRYKLGIFLVSLTTLFYEILLTRVFAVIIYYHFASLAIALALLGLSIGAVFYYLTQKYFAKDHDKIIYYSFIFYCLSYLLVFLLLIIFSRNAEKVSTLLNYFRNPFYRPTQSITAEFNISSYLILWSGFFFVLLPFVLSGFLSSLFLTISIQEIEKIYFWNLFGTSLGCIFIFIFLPLFGASNSFLFICVFGLFCGIILLFFEKKKKILLASILFPVFALFLFAVKIDPARINFVRLRFTRPLKNQWNSYSHVAVYPFQGDMEVSGSWGLSRAYTGYVPPHLNMVVNEIDYTPIINYDGDLSKLEFLKYDLVSLPYYLLEAPKTLIIGPGGGKEILAARLFNASHVSAVEINPLVIKFVQDKFNTFSGRPYSLENVEAIVADGRNYVKRSRDTFDLITATQVYAYLDPVGSAFSFTENYLYTKESFIDYLDHLSGRGMIAVIKPLIPEERLRLFSLARASLESKGEKEFSRHLMLIKERGMNIFIVKKERFSQGEIDKVKVLCGEKQFELVFYPGLDGTGDLFDFIKENDANRFYQKYPLDISPSTDDKPFFSTFLKAKDFWSGTWPKEKKDFPLRVIFILRKFLFIFLFTDLLLIAVFVLIKRNLTVPSYFSLLGIGYMLIEITLIRKFIFFLGHPVYAVSVILFSLLLFNAIGSLTGVKVKYILKNKIIIFILLLFLVMLYSYPLDRIFTDFIYLNIIYKIILTTILIFPLGYLMGIPFPLGLSSIKEEDREAIPYIWAVNGASSVFGSLLALVLSMSFGYNLTFLLAGLIYLLAGILLNKKNNIL